MGKFSIKNLESNPDYQDYIQNRRPAEQGTSRSVTSECAKREMNEVKTLHHAITKDGERRQQVLPQQLELRNAVKSSLTIDDAVAVIDLYIFGDATNGDADEVVRDTSMRDAYKLDYAVTNWG